MTRVYVLEVLVPAVTVTVTWKEPVAEGVPLIVPVELMLSPAGSPVAAHEGVPVPPVAARVVL
jgi:hypothetical protein